MICEFTHGGTFLARNRPALKSLAEFRRIFTYLGKMRLPHIHPQLQLQPRISRALFNANHNSTSPLHRHLRRHQECHCRKKFAKRFAASLRRAMFSNSSANCGCGQRRKPLMMRLGPSSTRTMFWTTSAPCTSNTTSRSKHCRLSERHCQRKTGRDRSARRRNTGLAHLC